ncbi:sugar ABC transporter substrate-binding protein [Mycobacterium sp. MS1601]|uniref:sugar ABC transporter substrate-binding protein n=1 Tax=Mycobacterium sp. MS1601 TaxID=1936029 RepID=UPI001F2EA29E|nr:sugar ABC transporter substrate-binding protein [Mycobacterium sp. MS1601]
MRWVASAVACMSLAACSSVGSGATSVDGADSMDVDGAREAYTAALAEPVFEAPGPAFDAAEATGKLIFNIPASSSIPYLEAMNENMADVAERVGVRYKYYANQGQPDQWTQGVQQAINEKADVLVLSGAPDPALLQPQLKEARAAGVKVIVASLYPDGTALPDNVDALVTLPSVELQSLVTDYAIANSGESLNALVLIASEFPSTGPLQEAVVAELEKRCGNACKYRVIDTKLADWATKIPTKVQSSLAADADINWIISIYDGMAPPAASGIEQAGRTGKVQITTGDASLGVLRSVADGVVAQDAGYSSDWIAWATVDQALRILSGQPALATAGLPIRMFDKTNIDAVGNPPVQDQGWGDSYVDGYLKLWGMG